MRDPRKIPVWAWINVAVLDSAMTDKRDAESVSSPTDDSPAETQHHSLKYHLLGPSLTKSGQDGVDQEKVSDIIYNASNSHWSI